MANITTVELPNLSGEGTQVHIIITHDDGSITTMSKEVWDAQEAAKENGTISQNYDLITGRTSNDHRGCFLL